MTFEEFRNVTQRRNAFDIYWHYGVAILVGLFCIIAFFYVTFIEIQKYQAFRYVIYPGLLLLLAISVYSVFYLLPNRYKIIEIPSSLSSENKHKVATLLLSEFCGITKEMAYNYIVSNLKKRWWQSTFTLHFYYDDFRFAFSLQGNDYNGGWIDLGETERKRKNVKEAIERLINQ